MEVRRRTLRLSRTTSIFIAQTWTQSRRRLKNLVSLFQSNPFGYRTASVERVTITSILQRQVFPMETYRSTRLPE